MVVLRATRKVLQALPESAIDGSVSDTALGDWYVNRITLDHQPLLLLVSEKSRLSMLAPARDVKSFPSRLGQLLATRLKRLRVDEELVRAEVSAMEVVLVGPTRDRSVTGQMVDFAKAIPYHVAIGEARNESALRVVEDKLGDTPCRCSGSKVHVIWPVQEAVRLLTDRWSDQC